MPISETKEGIDFVFDSGSRLLVPMNPHMELDQQVAFERLLVELLGRLTERGYLRLAVMLMVMDQ